MPDNKTRPRSEFNEGACLKNSPNCGPPTVPGVKQRAAQRIYKITNLGNSQIARSRTSVFSLLQIQPSFCSTPTPPKTLPSLWRKNKPQKPGSPAFPIGPAPATHSNQSPAISPIPLPLQNYTRLPLRNYDITPSKLKIFARVG